ncbi:LysM peptidoglycan-binding domain-containing protein [Parafannyhessea umbonata]|uniref:LysM domain-containing protein n=1 Tax=Parafannyhessea umbonata TaxID=604330 RepID=A0A1H9QK82_9ACTN|nr:LysM peptidoglycan-binding domain-containing protein [Parafannyhessea umbonata]SER60193.1 LysM domain-containing protein [Parafannyhessea umbonata]
MNNASCAYAVDGNLALKPVERRRLILVEGSSCGGRRADFVPEAPAAASPKCVGSLLVFVTASLMLLGAMALGSTLRAQRLSAPFSNVSRQTVEVSSGDSVWTIAEQHPVEGASTRSVADWIIEANGLEQSNLSVGQALVVPA